MIKIDSTKSFCPKCMKIINADVISKRGTVYIKKKCDEHGVFQSRHSWDKEKVYRTMADVPKNESPDSLVLHLTSRCNQHCSFCYAMANERGNRYELSKKDIEKNLKQFKGEWVLLSGGEPTVRDDIFDVIKIIKKMKFKALLCTNGKKLVDEEYVKKLKDAGLDIVNLQFDTFSDKNYVLFRGEPLLYKKMKVIENLKKYKINTILFVMVIKNRNMKEIKSIMDFVEKNKDCIKVVYFERAWKVGRNPNHKETYCSDIIDGIRTQIKIEEDEIIESANFCHYLQSILKKINGTNAIENPGCELNCYVILYKNRVIPLTRIVCVQELNKMLKFIYGNKSSIVLKTIISTPYAFYVIFKSFIEKQYFKILLSELIKGCGNISSKILFYSPFIQLKIRIEPEVEDIDLNILKNYNLYSDNPNGEKIVPAYFRHMESNKLRNKCQKK